MFDPSNFTFREVMILYLSVMLANIILLDIYNTMGLPTSTTVALVFCLLGSALATSIAVITSNEAISLAQIGNYINSTRAMAIVAGILLSVILAFSCGSFVMYISRIIFSFRYKKIFNRFGPLWCGMSFTSIVYFALFKGLKGILAGTAAIEFINDNMLLALFICWIACSMILYFLSMFRVNILKLNILAGTFALALAFAGNDLVNFVGVPVAGYDSYMLARESGDTAMKMGALASDEAANMGLLLIAGLIMIVTLWTSKRALSVSQTEISLSSQDESDGKFSSTPASRGVVRMAMNVNSTLARFTPQCVIDFIRSRFVKLSDEERTEGGSYDLIRATVNLTTVGDTDFDCDVAKTAALDHLCMLHGVDGFVARRQGMGTRKRGIPHLGRTHRRFGVVRYGLRRIPDSILRRARADVRRQYRHSGRVAALRLDARAQQHQEEQGGCRTG